MADVLIVDDDATTADALARLLRQDGLGVTCVQSAGDALRLLRAGPADLVLLDLGMPRVGGMDLLEALSQEARFAHIPIALYTGLDDSAARDVARQLGACDYILKGEQWPELRSRIRKCLGEEGN